MDEPLDPSPSHRGAEEVPDFLLCQAAHPAAFHVDLGILVLHSGKHEDHRYDPKGSGECLDDLQSYRSPPRFKTNDLSAVDAQPAR